MRQYLIHPLAKFKGCLKDVSNMSLVTRYVHVAYNVVYIYISYYISKCIDKFTCYVLS